MQLVSKKRYSNQLIDPDQDYSKIRELFETSIQTCLKLQNEKGINKTVQENKKKQVRGKSKGGRFYLDEEDEKEVEQEDVPKKKTPTSFFSTLSKVFSFGSQPSKVKA